MGFAEDETYTTNDDEISTSESGSFEKDITLVLSIILETFTIVFFSFFYRYNVCYSQRIYEKLSIPYV